MTITDYSSRPKSAKRNATTVSFGAHRRADKPASALRAGASSMPAAWQTRGMPKQARFHEYNIPARSFGDILLDPFRWVLSIQPRKLSLAGIAVLAVLILIF